MVKFKRDLYLATPTLPQVGMGILLVDEEPMMNTEGIDEGTTSLEEEMYRQEVYRKHTAALTALRRGGVGWGRNGGDGPTLFWLRVLGHRPRHTCGVKWL